MTFGLILEPKWWTNWCRNHVTCGHLWGSLTPDLATRYPHESTRSHTHTNIIYIYTYVYIASSRLLEPRKPELGWYNLSIPWRNFVAELTSFIRVIIIIIIISISIIIIIIIINCCRKFTWMFTSSRKFTWTLTSHPTPPTPRVRSINCCRKFTWTLTSCRKFTWTLTSHPTPLPTPRVRSINCCRKFTWTLTSHPTPPPHRMWFQKPGRAYIYIYTLLYIYMYMICSKINILRDQQSRTYTHGKKHSSTFFLSFHSRQLRTPLLRWDLMGMSGEKKEI